MWGTTETKKKLHLISWEKITKPKANGGLGLQSAKERNSALLAKLNWCFHQEKDAPWARVLSHKYITRRRWPPNKFRSCSPTWAEIKRGEPIFNKGIKWIAGKDSSLSFWRDKWLSDGTIRSLIEGPLQRNEETLLIRDVMRHNSWNLGDISFSFPYSLKAENQSNSYVRLVGMP